MKAALFSTGVAIALALSATAFKRSRDEAHQRSMAAKRAATPAYKSKSRRTAAARRTANS
jgi:hypothetical protein